MEGSCFLKFFLSHFGWILLILFFCWPLLLNLFDFLSGRSRRKAAENQLQERSMQLDAREQALLVRSERINGQVRDRTIELVRDIASRPYLQDTPAFQAILQQEDGSCSRLRSTLTGSFKIAAPFDISAKIQSQSGNSYHTTLFSCSCKDFVHRKIPCKHMFRLALECGLLFNFTAADIEKDVSDLLAKRDSLQQDCASLTASMHNVEQEKRDFSRLVQEQSQHYPWLAQLYADFFQTYDDALARQLAEKSHPALRAAEDVARISKEKRTLLQQSKSYEYQLNYLRSVFPWLDDFMEVPPMDAYANITAIEDDLTAQSEYEQLSGWLSTEEYSQLSNSDKFQLALDRYSRRQKTNWDVGIEYERYIGYLCEQRGYTVRYNGATRKLEDMGRDLIVSDSHSVHIIQCKRWAREKVIHENHVFQLYGSTMEYQRSHPEKRAVSVFVTSTKFSETANLCAPKLDILLFPEIAFQHYPLIKCNISRNGEKIYHLPFDQQYDNVFVRPSDGDFYAGTVSEAESAGFRRAFRWTPD